MDRRLHLLEQLKNSSSPVLGSQLAETLAVTRQTIVSDISLLRREGYPILSTPQGYLIAGATRPEYREVMGIIHTREQLQRELEILVGHRVTVEDVFIEHPVYGRIEGSLKIATLKDVKEFLMKRSQTQIPLFSEVTGGLHYHTLVSENPEYISQAKAALQQEGFELL